MNNDKTLLICLFLVSLIVMLPVVFAQEIKATDGVTFQKNTDSSKLKNGRIVSAQTTVAVDAFVGLVGWLASLLSAAGITFIVVGAAVIIGGYVIYRAGKTAWTYYTAYSYSKWYDHHSYKKHIINSYEFENIWSKKKPTEKQFEDKCKDSINGKSSNILKFIQKSNGRFISYDTVTKMIVVGETDGKTIVTCYKDTTGELKRNTNGSSPNWVKFK